MKAKIVYEDPYIKLYKELSSYLEDEDLKLCPHCKHEPIVVLEGLSSKSLRIQCNNTDCLCGTRSKDASLNSLRQLIEIWNRRVVL